MSELKPCPFCGGEAEPIHQSFDAFYVICHGCYTTGKTYKTEAEAIAAWNTRAERTCHWTGTVGCGLADGPYDEEEDACISFAVVKHFLDCGHCSITESMSPPNYCPNCGAKVIEEEE